MVPTTEFSDSSSQTTPLHLETSELGIRHILVATDFSEPAHLALQAAIEIAQLYNSDIVLVHGSFPANFAAGEGVIPEEYLVDQLAEDKRQMQELIASHAELAQLHVDTVVEYSDPIALIERLVKKSKIDLVIVGSHGSSGLERLVLGSVAESVAYSTTCPVLIMGPQALNEGELFKSIVFATDLSTTGLRPAQYASSFAERLHSQLLVLHVVEKPLDTAGDRSDSEATLLQAMQTLLPKDAALSCSPQFRVEYGSAASEIVKAAREVGASLLVVGARRRHAFADHLPWQTLSKVVHEAGCGVLVVRNRFA